MLHHPEIITEGFVSNDLVHLTYKGLIQCKVLPPRQLLIPLLHLKTNGKLMFPLCSKCALEGLNISCPHSDNERSWEGVYTHVELIKAVELGYKLKGVSEVWHWKEWKSGMFSPYVNCFYQIKEEVCTSLNNSQ